MKVSENKPHSIHLRLTDEQYQFLKDDADMLGIGVSEYVRMIINTTMYTVKKVGEKMQESLGGPRNANIKSNIEHQL